MTDAERFFSHVEIGPDCWQWLGGANTSGYGRFLWGGKTGAAHRFAYEMAKGSIPPRHLIDHLCRNHGCVNPAHLEVVTPRENLMRGVTTHAARNARKTHCPQGHPYSAENTYNTGANRRLCKTCIKARNDATAEYRRQYYKARHQHISSDSS